jgi:hypothetical protein
MSTDNNRVHDKLRAMVDKACRGLLPHIADRIRDAARRAYCLGVEDGMRMAREEEEDPTPWCHACGAMEQDNCDCLPIADNN